MKRKIITNKNTPLAKENPKDFSELMAEYNSASGVSGSNSGYFKILATAAIAASLVGGFFFFSAHVSQDTSENTQTPAEIKALNSYEIPSWTIMVAVNEKTTLVSPKGVILEIPVNAFSTSNLDSVRLTLTHFDDVASIIHSQIPMNYDSLGTEFHFQTDGMFELTATQNETKLKLAKNISVHYPQSAGVKEMNTYALTENETWNYAGNSDLSTYKKVCENTVYKFNQPNENLQMADSKILLETELTKLAESTQILEKQIKTLEKGTPLEPKKQNLSNYRFTLDVKPEEFPELSHFENVIFEVKDSRFNFSIYDQTWNDISVKKSPKEGRYLITLKNTQRLEIFDVYPVLTEEEYALAYRAYAEKMKEIELSKKDKKHQIKENKKREADFMAALELQRENKAQTLKKIAERSKLINALTADIKEDSPYRSISIGSLGIVNFDLPITLPAKGVNVPADFVISQTSTSVGAVSLIDLSNKTFYTYRKENFKEFRLRKNTEYIIVSILPDGQLAAYKSRLNSEQFKNGTPHRFILEKAPKYESLEELKEFLGIDFIDA